MPKSEKNANGNGVNPEESTIQDTAGMYQTPMDAPRTGGAKLEPEIGGLHSDEPTAAGASVLDPEFNTTGAVTFAPSMGFGSPRLRMTSNADIEQMSYHLATTTMLRAHRTVPTMCSTALSLHTM